MKKPAAGGTAPVARAADSRARGGAEPAPVASAGTARSRTNASTAATCAQSEPSRQLHAPKHSSSASATLTVKVRLPSATPPSTSSLPPSPFAFPLPLFRITPPPPKIASPRDTSTGESFAREDEAAAAALSATLSTKRR